MKKLDCQCCGAALPIPERYQRYIKCKYCDATYEIENYETPPAQSNDTIFLPEPRYILIEPGHIQKLCAAVTVEEEKIRYYPPEVIAKYVQERLTEQIMEYLAPNLKVEEAYDIGDFSRVYRTVIRLDTRGY